MQMSSRRGMILLLTLAVVIALTTLPASVRLIDVVTHLMVIEGHPNLHDAIGHSMLFGTLTAVIYWAIHRPLGFGRAFWIALLTAMLLGGLTELIQQYSPGRAMQLSDLLGDWVGAMSVAVAISFHRSVSVWQTE